MLQHCVTILFSGEVITQRPGETVEDGRVEQEDLNTFRQAAEHFLQKKIRDVSMAARESLYERPAIAMSLQCKSGQLQSRDPAFCPRFERRDLLCDTAEMHRLFEERRSLSVREAKIGGADLD